MSLRPHPLDFSRHHLDVSTFLVVDGVRYCSEEAAVFRIDHFRCNGVQGSRINFHVREVLGDIGDSKVVKLIWIVEWLSLNVSDRKLLSECLIVEQVVWIAT